MYDLMIENMNFSINIFHFVFHSVDGVPFLMRDRTLRRTTDVNKVFPERQFDDASLFNWTEIRSLNAGQWFLEVLKSTLPKITSISFTHHSYKLHFPLKMHHIPRCILLHIEVKLYLKWYK